MGEPLKLILDQLISPRLIQFGLKWRGDYYWIGENNDGIRRVVHYSLLTSGGYRGVLTWGVALDFVVLPSGGKLIYNRTARSAKLHLFEWPQGYIDCFSGTEIVDGNGVVSHSSQIIFQTLDKVINDELPNIERFFRKSSELEGLIEITKEQIEKNTSLGQIHNPSPMYILAFLYAKNGQKDKACDMLENTNSIIFNGKITKEDIKKKLLAI